MRKPTQRGEGMRQSDSGLVDLSLLERVNPVFHTAKMALGGLAMAGDEDAAMLCERLGIGFTGAESGQAGDEKNPLQAIQELANSVFLEMRFSTVGAMALESGCSTMVDLPCGFTPRGLQMMRRKRPYVGLDLPATIHELERVMAPYLEAQDSSYVRYAPVDATNYASLEEALRGVQSPICITTEGLLMYLNDFETGALCDNVRHLLEIYGGCWITSDPEMMIQNTSVMRAIAGDRYQEVMDNLMKGFESKADIHVEAPTMMILPWKNGGKRVVADTEKALSFLEERGLQAQRLVVGEHMPQIHSFSLLDPETVKEVKAGMQGCGYWKITRKEEGTQKTSKTLKTAKIPKTKKTEEFRSETFGVLGELTEEGLKISLKGRVDTLTAPHVLELYEKISEGAKISQVLVDCEKLEYISSAGLRVLLLMRRKHRVKIQGVNRLVRQILETTGSEELFDIEAEA